VRKRRKWAVQCHGVTPAIPHSNDTMSGMAAQRWVGRTMSGSDSQAMSGGWRNGDSLLTQAPAMRRRIYYPGRGSRQGAAGRGKSRARQRFVRGAGTLERGGDSFKGPGPRWGCVEGASCPQGGGCRMDLPGPTTLVGTRTDYSVGPWDYPTCAARHLLA
jgi:hypothetical protein